MTLIRTRWFLAGVTMVAALGACSDDSPPEPPLEVAYHDSEIGRGDEQPAAELTGILVRTGGCTYVEQSNGDRVVPVFPNRGIRWEDQALVVGSTTFRLGEEVALSGGGATRVSSLPPGCDPAAGHFAVYSTS